MIISSAKISAPPAATPSRRPRLEPWSRVELRPREVQRGQHRHEREQAGGDAARVAEGLEQRVVLESGEDELHHLPERLLDVACVRAEEADQAGVGQRGEDEPGHEHHRERPEADDRGGDRGRRLTQRPELPDELGLGAAGAGPARVPARARRAGERARREAPRPRAGSGCWGSVGGGRRPAALRPRGSRRGFWAGPFPRRRLLAGGSSTARSGWLWRRFRRGRRGLRRASRPAARWVRSAAAARGAPQFGQKRARSSSLLPHWSQNAIPGPQTSRVSGAASGFQDSGLGCRPHWGTAGS